MSHGDHYPHHPSLSPRTARHCQQTGANYSRHKRHAETNEPRLLYGGDCGASAVIAPRLWQTAVLVTQWLILSSLLARLRLGRCGYRSAAAAAAGPVWL